jgi:demethylmenaquinone methyltransferase / 2-methoxy-6-polyprenyl-1,4-benzoquinol methylase
MIAGPYAATTFRGAAGDGVPSDVEDRTVTSEQCGPGRPGWSAPSAPDPRGLVRPAVGSVAWPAMTAPASWNRDTLPEGDEKREAVRDMFDAIAPRYDLVNRVMTFRLDVRWRRKAVATLRLPPGSRILDLASGTGDLCVDLARAGYRPISVDLSLGMLRADRSGAPRAQADILRLPVPAGAVDGVTCGFALRNLVDLAAFFAELGRVVRPGGRVALLDVGIPHNRIVRFGNGIYFGKVVPRIGALLSDAAAYRYLPRSVAYLPPPDEMIAMLRAAGFGDAAHTDLSGGITQLLTGTR